MVLGEKSYNETLYLLAGNLISARSPANIAHNIIQERISENTGFYDGFMKDSDLLKEARWQMRSELGYEWASELNVFLVEDTGPLMPPGG
jgi:hypothetical protein